MTVYWEDKTDKLLVFLFLLIFSVSSCQKKENSIGADFVGQRDPFSVAFKDTTTLVAVTCLHDSIRTRSLSYYMLGSINDPEVGPSDCHIMTTYSLPYQQFVFTGTPITIDSVVLQLTYASTTNYYGNLDDQQDIYVYEMNEVLSTSSDSLYFSNRDYNYASNPVGHYTGSFNNIDDSVDAGTPTKLAPHIRIRLDETDPVIKNRLISASSSFSSDSLFQTVFKGLAIVSKGNPASGKGCLAYMNVRSAVSGVMVYYHNSTDTLLVLFPMDPITRLSIHANSFKHQYTSSVNVQPQFSAVHSDVNFLQPGAGLKTRIMMPHLFDLIKNQKISLTGAELVFTIKSGTTTSPYTLPESLLIKASDSLGRNATLKDEIFDNAYYGGAIEGGTKVRFNIVRHLQYILDQYRLNNRNLNYGLNLYVPVDAPVTAQRVILDTRRNAGVFKLNLTYTVIK